MAEPLSDGDVGRLLAAVRDTIGEHRFREFYALYAAGAADPDDPEPTDEVRDLFDELAAVVGRERVREALDRLGPFVG